MRASLVYGLAIGLFCLTLSCKKDNNSITDADKLFMTQAAYSNKAEIAVGNLALTKGLRDSIRIFGQDMVGDHITMQRLLDSLALPAAITLPATPDSAHIAFAKMLNGLTGYTFDTAYIHAQVKDHQNAIRVYQKVITDGHNIQVRQYAIDNLLRIQDHYNRAVSISLSE